MYKKKKKNAIISFIRAVLVVLIIIIQLVIGLIYSDGEQADIMVLMDVMPLHLILHTDPMVQSMKHIMIGE